MVAFTWRGWIEKTLSRRIRGARSMRRPTLRRPQIESLEPRRVLTAITVTESGMGNDGNGVGPGKDGTWSLLEAIEFLNNNGGSGDSITLAANVTLSGALPALNEGITLNGGGFTISGGGLEIDGDDAKVSNVTFQNSTGSSLVIVGDNAVLSKVIASGAVDSVLITGDNAKITGSKIFNNSGSGLVVEGNGATIGGTSSSDQDILYGSHDAQLVVIGNSGLIEGNLVGTRDGTTASNVGVGIFIQGASNTVGGTSSSARNIISGNGGQGLEIHDVESVDNLVEGNYIGVDSSGSKALGNHGSGISIGFGATNNTVGGTADNERNIISANGLDGVAIGESGTKGNLVEGNYIGTDVSGAKALGNGIQNGFFGVEILDGAQSNTIGGTADGALNVISGNYAGIGMDGVGTSQNVALGNMIGVQADGATVLANQVDGVDLYLGASSNTIGGTADGALNVISGNKLDGVYIVNGGATTELNVVLGNMIGVDKTGKIARANGGYGVDIAGGSENTIGGLSDASKNVISGNTQGGVLITGNESQLNAIQGNSIGVDTTQKVALANHGAGVLLSKSASNNEVGGSLNGAANVISGNTGFGVEITDIGTARNVVAANMIGVDVDGKNAMANGAQGVVIQNGATDNTIGGDAEDDANVISGNNGDGVQINGNGTNANVVSANNIGTDKDGANAIANKGNGVVINGGANNTIGGSSEAEGNTISGNQGNGVSITGAQSTGNVVSANSIGTDSTGNTAIANTGFGVLVSNAANNTIGGASEEDGNTISGNTNGGLEITGPTATGNFVAANTIGTDGKSHFAIANGKFGIEILGATGNTIGGQGDPTGNTISGNNGVGLWLSIGANNNLIQTNSIGTDGDGSKALANTGDGILLFGANNNTIGGTQHAVNDVANVISGNGADGIQIDNLSTGNVILGNMIGANKEGTSAVGNAEGVLISSGSGNTIGGATLESANVISGNAGAGIDLKSGGNLVQGNNIGVDVDGGIPVANGLGISISSGSNTIGGTVTSAGNVISGNKGDGILLTGTTATKNLIQQNTIGADVDGKFAVANVLNGIEITAGASNNTIGGIVSGASTALAANVAVGDSKNVISGNTQNGILISGSTTTGNVVQNNVIGTRADDTAQGIPNQLNGILITSSSSRNVIGGTAAGASNTIAFNGKVGVDVASGAKNSILSNSIASNGGIGIDLGDNGVTTNGSKGATGPNNYLQFPTFSSVVLNGSNLSVNGSVTGAKNTTETVQFFANDAADPSGFGEGQTLVGTISVSIGATGTGKFSTTLTGVSNGQFLTATATDANGNTSEFSQAQLVGVAGPTFQLVADPATAGNPDDFTVTVLNPDNSVDTAFTGTVEFVISDTGVGAMKPVNYMFQPSDNGTKSFQATFVTAGTQTLTVENVNQASMQTTTNVTVSPGDAATMKFLAAPAAGSVGKALDQPGGIQVALYDSFGNLATNDSSSVSLQVASGPGNFTLSSITTEPVQNGVAVFQNVALDTAGTYSLSANDGVLPQLTSPSFTVTQPVASKQHLVIVVQPTVGVHGANLLPIEIEVVNAKGKVVTTDNSTITLQITSGPGTFTPTSLVSVKARHGMAVFNQVALSTGGSKYVLTAVDGTVTPVTLAPISIA